MTPPPPDPWSLIEALPTPTLVLDSTGKLLQVSQSWRAALEQSAVKDPSSWLPGANLPESLEKLAQQRTGGTETADRLRTVLRQDSDPVEISVPFASGSRSYIVATNRVPDDLVIVAMTDISQRRAAEAQLAHQASHDTLTGLANRDVLIDRLRQLSSKPYRKELARAVFFLDLDNFKAINDNLGHAAGDDVLQEVARRLQVTVRDGDLVARLGGDEFVVVAADLSDELAAVGYSDRLLRALAPPVVVDGQPVSAQASIGIALSSPRDHGSDSLLRQADIAMLKAKADRAGHRVFDVVLSTERRHRSDLLQQLKSALQAGAIVPWFQPVVDLQDGSVVGAEALVRWVHSTGRVGLPGEFIPSAERAGLIGPLDRAVMLSVAASLTIGHLRELASCSVNSSPMEVSTGLIVEEVTEVLVASGLPPERLTVEVTETALLGDPARARQHLGALKDLGVQVALDDFGTGFSSLSHLATLPIDVVKLDQSFVRELVDNDRACEICRAVVNLGRALGMDVIAEGVETLDQRDALTRMSCPFVQGHLYGKAVAPEDFASLHLVPAPA